MTENLQQGTQKKEPFSPLQSGCAFVMLTNMLIYLGVVLFTFNLLDPSKIDASYLAKRGFTARPEEKSEQDSAFQQLSKEKQEQQKAVQEETIDTSKLGAPKDNSPAGKLSEIRTRNLSESRPEEPEKPTAALTQSSLRSGGTAVRAASTRLYSIAIYPQATLPQTYSPYNLPTPRTVTPETYQTLQVEMASGINTPTFSLPTFDSTGAYLYRAPDPIPEASRGGLKLSVPPVGAESLYTNRLKKATELPPVKDKL